jgi:alkanesulfonate monooxygenase SsuD/methylene tetrahydromethanopterin reductase-like flavin-dependent oxidoreductase (luciferase family)
MIEGQEDVTWEDWLGTMVSPVTFRHPSELAKVVSTADRVSGGRIEVGLGAGWNEPEHEAYGFPFPPLGERMAMLEEQLRVATGQWADGPFSFEGRHYAIRQLDARPKPVQRPRPPIILGGSGGPRSLRLAARYADESRGLRPLTAGCAGVSPEYQDRRRVCRAAAQPRRGLPPRGPGCHPAVAHDRLARWRGPRRAARRAGRLAEWRGQGGGAEDFLRGLPDAWLAGTLDELTPRLEELAEAGVERVLAQHLLHRDLDAVEQIGRRVAPAVG